MSTLKLLASFVLGVVTIPLLVVVVAEFGLFAVHAVDRPPAWEERLAARALNTALEKGAQGLQSPVADNDDTLLAGLKLYRNDCAGCHGEFGSPSRWGSSNFYPRVPQFSVQPPDRTPAEMFVAVKYGIRYSGMGAWNGMMSDEDIWRVTLFLNRLKSLPPAVDAVWHKTESGGAGGA